MTVRIAPGVLEIDTLLGGWDQMTASYLIEGDRPVLIETGSQSSAGVLLGALAKLGVGPDDLAGVAVSHIHLDHAGGVGDVARTFPRATVYVHPKGARHLVDPARLLSSASLVYGPLLDSLYGRLDPTPAERIVVLEDGDEIDLGGGRSLRAIDSPGHAKHHLGLLDSSSGLLFAGDAAGVRLPDSGVLRPATPPPDFDLDLALASLRRFADSAPSGIALAHYGVAPFSPGELLAEAAEGLQAWAGEAERAWRRGEDIAAALEARFAAATAPSDASAREKLETLNGFHSNAAGFLRWLEQRRALPGMPLSPPGPGGRTADGR
ncbi:MAG: MBL fold metallo-hydrolase [Actinomycetota bacterium]|nr:MBL fold metallo-hydrolase [Actinomycetota bacterium]